MRQMRRLCKAVAAAAHNSNDGLMVVKLPLRSDNFVPQDIQAEAYRRRPCVAMRPFCNI